uniref:Uncharacterized protein n=1 Tax=Trichuris muris TaxID=70415 RepID=A0A5S6QYK2_TRIMR
MDSASPTGTTRGTKGIGDNAYRAFKGQRRASGACQEQRDREMKLPEKFNTAVAATGAAAAVATAAMDGRENTAPTEPCRFMRLYPKIALTIADMILEHKVHWLMETKGERASALAKFHALIAMDVFLRRSPE